MSSSSSSSSTAIDTFQREYDQLKRQLAQLQRDVSRRDTIKEAGKPVGAVEADIRGSLKNIEADFMTLNQLIKDSEKQMLALGLTTKQIEQRRSLVGESMKQKQQILDQFHKANAMKQTSGGLKEDFVKRTAQKEQNERIDVENQSSMQIYKSQQKEIDQQDKKIEAMLTVVGRMQNASTRIDSGVQESTELLNDLDIGIDKNIKAIKRSQEILKTLLKNRSNFCLLSCIGVEIFFLIFFILIL